MTKKRNSVPSQTTYNPDIEINIKEYPYYRRSPIKMISDMQNKLYGKPSLTVDQFPPLRTHVSYKEKLVKSEEKSIKVEETVTASVTAPNLTPVTTQELPPFPVFGVDPQPAKTSYNNEKTVEDMHKEIDANAKTIREQEEAISINNETIKKQAELIYSQNDTIKYNTSYITEQINAYNYNQELANRQSYMYQNNNTCIVCQEQELNMLKEKVAKYQDQIEKLREEAESYRQQQDYHNKMQNAFNTLLENPDYFTQLMALSLSNMSPA